MIWRLLWSLANLYRDVFYKQDAPAEHKRTKGMEENVENFFRIAGFQYISYGALKNKSMEKNVEKFF
jgi:hypothetical protein